MKSNRAIPRFLLSCFPDWNRFLWSSLLRAFAVGLLCLPAFGASVTGTLKNPDGTGFTNVVLFRPKLDRAVLISSTLTPYVDTRVTPGTNGGITVDLRAGDYLVYAGPSRPFAIAVPDSTNSYELTALVTGTNILSAGPFNIVSTTVGNATASSGGKVKTDSTASDPTVYLKTSADTAIAAATAAVGATNRSSPWVLARYWGLTNYWSIGDSHTYGGLASGPFTWTDSGSRILSAYRYADQLAATNGLNLNNLAVSGSSHLFPQINSGPSSSHLNQIGRNLDAPTWSGVVTTMGGFNDALPTMASDAWIRAGRLAGSAMIARLFATNYTVLANGRTATGGTNSTWSTTGTVLGGGGNTAYNPFPWGTPGTDDRDVLTLKSGARAVITPTSGQTVLIYELTSDGGTAAVWINGTNVVNLDTTLPSPATTQRMPAALFIPYSGAQIIITNTSGTNYLSALVQLPAPSDCTNRVVVIGAPIQLSTSVRSASVAKALGDAAWGAAVQFADFPIYFADPNTVIDPVVDVIGSADPNHFNPSGQRKIFKAFMGAVRVSQNPRRNAFQGSIGDQVVINGSASGTMNLAFARQGTNRVELSANASGDLIAAMIDAAGNSLGTALTIAQSGRVVTAETTIAAKSGGVFSGIATPPAYNYVELGTSGGNAYLFALTNGSASVTIPLTIYANGISFANAGTAAGLTTTGLIDLGNVSVTGYIATAGVRSTGAGTFTGANSTAPSANYMALAHTGGNGYLLSLSSGSLSSTLPLIIYASTLNLANAGNITGATFVAPTLGAANATTVTTTGGLYSAGGGSFGGVPVAVARDAVLIYSTGGVGYIASLTNNSLSAKLPLSIYSSSLSLANAGNISGATFTAPSLGDATAATVTTTGGLYSAGGISAGGVPSAVARDAVLLYSTGGTGFLASVTNGSTSTKLPLSIYSSGLSLANAGAVSGATFTAPSLGAATASSVAIGTGGTTVSKIRHGTVTLTAGTATVTDGYVTASTGIIPVGQNSSGTAGELSISARVPGTSFTITSTSSTDTRLIFYTMIEP